MGSSPTRYGATAQALHWATAVLVLIAFLYGPGGSERRVYSAAANGDRQLHETLGRHPPLLGEHNEEVLAELGIGPAERAQLEASGAFAP